IEPVQPCAAARQNKSSGNLAIESGALQIVADERKQFQGARLDDVREHVSKNGARRTVAHAGNFDRAFFFLHESGSGAAVAALDALGFGNWRAKADGEIVCEVIAADSHGAGMTDHAA